MRTAAGRPRARVGLALLWLAAAAPLRADIAFDASVPGAALNGPDYDIPAAAGVASGANLFHSFERFGLAAGESATFSGPAGIAHVLARVTGGLRSDIDGTLRSSIAGASLWLINPAGVVFGPNASLDIQGSFHASSASHLKLDDGSVFSALAATDLSSLSAAPPAAFGFLGPGAGAVELRGAELSVAPLQTLSLVGGSVSVREDIGPGGVRPALLDAPAGRLQLAAVGSAGEVTPTADGFAFSPGTRGGAIQLSNSALTVAGPVGGGVHIRGGQVVLDGARVGTVSVGPLPGSPGSLPVPVSVEAGSLALRNGAQLFTAAQDGGRAGDLRLRAGQAEFVGRPGDGFDPIALITDPGALDALLAGYTGVASFVDATAAGGGTVQVMVDTLRVREGAVVASVTRGPGAGPSVDIQADSSVTVAERGLLGGITFAGTGTGGEVRVEAPVVRLAGDGTLASGGIGSVSAGPGDAGRVVIRAGRLDVSAGASVDATTLIAGRGGVIDVAAERIDLGPQSRISAATFGLGRGGDVDIVAGTVGITGVGFPPGADLSLQSGIDVSTYGPGQGGELRLRADALDVSAHGQVLSQAVLRDPRLGSGSGGNLVLEVGRIALASGGVVSATASGTGQAGNLTLSGLSLDMQSGSRLVTEAASGNGGNIVLRFVERVSLRDAEISTSVRGGTGAGGDIDIDPRFVILQRSRIVADAFGGPGGNIRIVADNFLADPASVVRASSALSIDGTVSIDAPQVDLAAAVQTLPEDPQDASALLSRRCEGRTAASQSSLLVEQPVAPTLGFVLPVSVRPPGPGPAGRGGADPVALGEGAVSLACGS